MTDVLDLAARMKGVCPTECHVSMRERPGVIGLIEIRWEYGAQFRYSYTEMLDAGQLDDVEPLLWCCGKRMQKALEGGTAKHDAPKHVVP